MTGYGFNLLFSVGYAQPSISAVRLSESLRYSLEQGVVLLLRSSEIVAGER